MANSNGLTPRQKMINLMYIVLTAMLALNVSSDVLDGFTQVDESLKRSNANYAGRNGALFTRLEELAKEHPDSNGVWLQKAREVRDVTNALLRQIDSLKYAMVLKADGPEGDMTNIDHRDDLEAAASTMLNPATLEGERLRLAIDSYRRMLMSLSPDDNKRRLIAASLNTAIVKPDGTRSMQSWEDFQFNSKPVITAVTLMSKLQNDIRFAEGEALNAMVQSANSGKAFVPVDYEIVASEDIGQKIGPKEARVNEFQAFVIPRSRNVMRGSKYQAEIVLAALAGQAQPTIYVGGRALPAGRNTYEFTASSSGNHSFGGYITVRHNDGSTSRHEFKTDYTVFDPFATVSATLVNVLYAGIDNPISISVPGMAMSQVSASMTNGTLTRRGDGWVARPSTIGTPAVITVSANVDGRNQTVGSYNFRVRKLPDPTAYIPVVSKDGNSDMYKGGRAIAKGTLLSAGGIKAAIDDEILNIPFSVVSFQTVVNDQRGDNLIENSAGASFSERQKAQLRELKPGRRVLITNIKAHGPDGVTRTISPLDVRVK